MKWSLRLFTLFATCAILFSLSSVCFATESGEFSDSDSVDVSDDVDGSQDEKADPPPSGDIGSITVEVVPSDASDEPGDPEGEEVGPSLDEDDSSSESFSGFTASGSISLSSDEPIEVIVVEEDARYSVRAASDDGLELVIDDEPPSNPPFYGACYVTGTDANLGRVTVYFPSTYKTGYFGVDASGYLFNVSGTGISGYLEDAYNNSVSASSFAYPRYRTSSSSGSYTYLYLIPESSNMEIATTNAPRVVVSDVLPYVTIFLLGVIWLCFMKRS